MGVSGLEEAKTPPERAARKFTIEVERATGGSTKPKIAFDANLSEQANAEASYALSEVAARK